MEEQIEDTLIEDTLIVETVNNSFIYIDTEDCIAREMAEYFSFMTPNYKFMPRFKNGLWDGKTRLYNRMGSTLPAGLFGILSKFASDNDYKLIDRRTLSIYKNATVDDIEAFCKDLNPHSSGKPIEHYDYQIKSVVEAVSNERATIVSTTSSGKSLIIYSLIRWYERIVNKKILVIVPTTNLVAQMYSDFDDYASESEWWAEANVHQIYSGKKKESNVTTYVSTWQSLQRMPIDYFKQFDVILCDEVHGADAKSITGIMGKSVNASVRVGFTGTLKNMKLHQLSVIGLFGDIKKVTTARELMDRGIITDLDIKFLILKYNDDISKEINRKAVERVTSSGKKIYRKNYPFEIDYITQCHQRNLFISNLTSVLKGHVLILFTKVNKHGKPLYKLLSKRLDGKTNVHYISGETKVDGREKIRGTLEDETNGVLIASYGTLSTGVNIKNLDYLIMASPYKSEIKVLQSIGRVLRLRKGKRKAVLFDVVDDFRYKKSVNHCFKHFSKRFDIYKEEKFPISISEYKLL